VIDVVPTVLELAGVASPREHDERPVPPLQGRSFARALADAQALPAHETLWWCHGGNRAVRVGDWKLVAAKHSPWELYDLANDRCETRNLAAAEPQRVNDLEATWNRIADECRVLAGEQASPGAKARTKRPNILYIIVDDQSPFDFRFYEPSSTLHAPTIERLAAEGMVFDAAYHMGSFSGAVCTPSRHMVMSGRSVWHLPIGPGSSKLKKGDASTAGAMPHCPPALERFTLAPVFNAAGYDTMRTCKQGNAYEAADALFTVRRDATKREGTPAGGSAWHGDQVLAYLEERERSQDVDPFLIYFGFSHPHDTRDGTPELLAKYGATNHTDKASLPSADPRQPPLPPNWLPQHPFDHGHMDVRDEVDVSGVWTNRDQGTIRNERGREYACSENIDRQIGRVLDKLESLGELDNTWIFYTSDHGMAIGRHGLQGKQNLYEHTWRVPLVVRGPGVRPGSRVQGNVYLGDSLATLCEICGIEPPATNEGMSFRSVLEGRQQTVRDVLYGVYCGGQKPGMRSVRQGDWKLIKYESPSGGLHTQLFNLADNPHEFLAEHHATTVTALTGGTRSERQRNLADDPAFATERARMEALLLAEMRRHDDPFRFSDQPPESGPP
jgi:arylsulfatase A-like enzyme